MSPDFLIRVLLIGDSSTGKSTLVDRFVQASLFGEPAKPTVGVDYHVHFVGYGTDVTKFKIVRICIFMEVFFFSGMPRVSRVSEE